MYDLLVFIFLNSFLLRGIVLFFLGMVIGSFLNVVIYRLPKILENKWHNNCCEYLGIEKKIHNKFNLLVPSSHCIACESPIPFYLNIPIIGYILARGKCIKCKNKYSLRYPLIETLTAILFTMVAYLTNDSIKIVALLVFISVIICLIFIDYDHKILPDELTIPLIWLGLLVNLDGLIAGSLTNSVLGAIIGYLSLWTVYWLFKLITKKDGMGYGDFKLMAAILAWIGCSKFIFLILFASFLGIIYYWCRFLVFKFTVKELHYKIREKEIPFGPFLGIIALLIILNPSVIERFG